MQLKIGRITRQKRHISVGSLAVIAFGFAVSLPDAAIAGNTCNTQRPRGGMGGFLGGMVDALGRRVTGTGFMGDLLTQSKKLLTDSIACALNDAERAKAVASQNAALNGKKTGAASKTSWKSGDRPGVGGGTEIVSRSVTDGQQCATQRTFITDVDGQQKSVEREMCQQGDGTWAAA